MNIGIQNQQIIRASAIVVPEYLKHRLSTGIDWLDEALGSKEKPGFIASTVMILAGDPGSGKSTILRQLCSLTDLETLYNSAEEMPEQIKLALDEKLMEAEFDVANFTNVDELIEAAEQNRYHVLVVDSVQALWTATDLNGEELRNKKAGSGLQVKAVTEKLVSYAKRTGTMVILICHSTKGGDFAGPQALEHVIDASAYIDVAKDGTRIFSLQKNRFGATQVEFPLVMGPHGLSLGESPEAYAQGKEIEAGEKKMPVKTVARRILAEMESPTKDKFVQAVLDETGASLQTATMYWSMLRRESR